jgi:ribonuclease D
VFRGGPVLIESQPALDALLGRLRSAGSFAYDSEFIGEASYTPKLCLVQIATTTEIALVDPLARLDLTGFWKLLCDPAVEKVVHAGQQDVEPVVRLIGGTPANVFDTQIAAGFCGLTYPVALAKLVGELIGAKLGKSMTFTQWDARPLSQTQLRYAADDVRYLPALRARLVERMTALGHVERARAEFEALCEPNQYRFDPDRYIHRVRGSGSLSANQLKILRELVVWRDQAARRADVPARAYLKDEVLIDLCRSPVKSMEKLSKVRGLPRPVETSEGANILAAIARGPLAGPIVGLVDNKGDEITPSQKFQADALWSACQAICHGAGVDPQIVTSRAELGRLVHAVTNNRPVPEDVSLVTGWRREFVGDRLVAMLTGGGEVRMRWADGTPTTGELV